MDGDLSKGMLLFEISHVNDENKGQIRVKAVI